MANKRKKKAVMTNGAISRGDLLDALNLVKPAVGGTDCTEEILTHFAFDGSNVMATNEHAFIKTPVEADVKCTVIADPFFKLVNGIAAEKVSLQMDGSELSLKTKSINSKFRTLEISEFSQPSKFSKKGKDVPTNFFEALYYCLKTVTKDKTDPVFRSIAVSNGDMISSDKVRLSFFPLAESMPDILIPLEAAEVIYALRDQITDFALVTEGKWDSWIGFNLVTKGILTAKLMEANFPVSRKHLKIQEFTQPLNFPPEILTTVERCKYFSEGLDKLERNIVTIDISKGEMVCSLQNPQLGDFTETLKTDSKLNTILAINLDHLDAVTQISLTAKLSPANPNTILFYNENLPYQQLISLEG